MRPTDDHHAPLTAADLRREHPQPPRRSGLAAGVAARRAPRWLTRTASPCTWTEPASVQRRDRSGRGRRRDRRDRRTVTFCVSKGLGAPVERALRPGRHDRAPARWRKAVGGGLERRRACWPRRACGRSTTWWTAWPRTTPTRAPWRRGWRSCRRPHRPVPGADQYRPVRGHGDDQPRVRDRLPGARRARRRQRHLRRPLRDPPRHRGDRTCSAPSRCAPKCSPPSLGR